MSDINLRSTTDQAPSPSGVATATGISNAQAGLSEQSQQLLSSKAETGNADKPSTFTQAELDASQDRLAAQGRGAKLQVERDMAGLFGVDGRSNGGFTLNDTELEPTLVQQVTQGQGTEATPQPDIDWDLISGFEGGAQLQGYVPDPEGSQSGVTIATGFDIGQRSHADLETLLGAENPLVDALAPYTGRTRQEAVAYLEENPVTITAEQAREIDQAVKADELDRLERRYNTAVGQNGTEFAELPAAAQTVIASVAFQYGNLETRTPSFWEHAVSQDWENLVGELRDFGDSYPTRRNAEANYLEDRL